MKLALAPLIAIAFIAGCAGQFPGGNQPPALKTVIIEARIDYLGAEAGQVKRLIAAPLVPRLLALPNTQSVTSVSEIGGFRAYVVASTTDADELLRQIRAEAIAAELPAKASQARLAVVDSVPQIKSSCRARVVVDLDPRRLAALGLTAGEVRNRIPKEAVIGTDDTDAVGEIVLRTVGNRRVTVADVANLYVTCGAPAVIVKTHKTP